MPGCCLQCLGSECDVRQVAIHRANLIDAPGLIACLGDLHYTHMSTDNFNRLVSLYDKDFMEHHQLNETQQEDLRRLHLYLMDNKYEGYTHETIRDLLFCDRGCKPDLVYYMQYDFLLLEKTRQHLTDCYVLPVVLVNELILPYLGPCIWLELESRDDDAHDNFICPVCLPDYQLHNSLVNFRVTG